MSTIQDKPGIWSLKESDSRYEKCRNITEEIYKRINITFQIKQLETAAQSDVSEQRYAYFYFLTYSDHITLDKTASLFRIQKCILFYSFP